jgi:hypothetical protein
MKKTEKILQAVKRLREVEEMLEMEGLFEQLEKIGAWSPRHCTERLEHENAKLREIAQWFADYFVDECYCSPVIQKAEQLRAELDRMKEGSLWK